MARQPLLREAKCVYNLKAVGYGLLSPRKRVRMKLSFVHLVTVGFLCTCAHAGDSRTLKSQCDKLIVKAEVLTAHHKWWAERPDPNAPVLNIRTHANFAKDFLLPLGAVFSHEKVGALTFEDQNGECLVAVERPPCRCGAFGPQQSIINGLH